MKAWRRAVAKEMKMPAVRGTMGLAVVTKRERMAAVMSMGVRVTAMAMRRLAERMVAAVMKTVPEMPRREAKETRAVREREREMMQAMVW